MECFGWLVLRDYEHVAHKGGPKRLPKDEKTPQAGISSLRNLQFELFLDRLQTDLATLLLGQLWPHSCCRSTGMIAKLLLGDANLAMLFIVFQGGGLPLELVCQPGFLRTSNSFSSLWLYEKSCLRDDLFIPQLLELMMHPLMSL